MSTPFYVAKAYNALVERPGDVGSAPTQITSVTLPAGTGCSVPVSVQFLAGRDGATVQNPATGTLVEVIIKQELRSTQRLARFNTTSAPSGSPEFFSGNMRMDSTELLAALAASTEQGKGVRLTCFIEVVYTLSGGHPVATVPLPCTIYYTGYASTDANPTLP